MQVHFRAGRSNLKGIPKPDLPRVKEVFKEGGHLMIPLVGLVFLLGSGIPVAFCVLHHCHDDNCCCI